MSTKHSHSGNITQLELGSSVVGNARMLFENIILSPFLEYFFSHNQSSKVFKSFTLLVLSEAKCSLPCCATKWEGWELNALLKAQTLPTIQALSFIQCDSQEIYHTLVWQWNASTFGCKEEPVTKCVACFNTYTRQMFLNKESIHQKVNCTFPQHLLWSLNHS